jgi:signal transduction histidine kinase
MNQDFAGGSSGHERSRHHPDVDRLRHLAAVGLMTPGVAHDLNNMLQVAGSVLRRIDRRIASGSSEELSILAADGLSAIDRAATISRRLMAFGRDGASVPRMRARVSVNGLLRDLEPMLRWSLGPATNLRLTLSDDALETWCDPQDLENAVMNLAVNARDAMPDGGVLALQTFGAELAHDVAGLPVGDYVMIMASDTGAGMAADILARAFEPSFTTKGGGGGFGMGLASVKSFVDACGGGADIVSRPAVGTTVRLYLPRACRA